MNQLRTTPEFPSLVGSEKQSEMGAQFTDLVDRHSDERRDLGALFNKEPMQQLKLFI